MQQHSTTLLSTLYWIATFYPLAIFAQLWVRVLPAWFESWLLRTEFGPLRIEPYLLAAGRRGAFTHHASSILICLIGYLLLSLLRSRMGDLASRATALFGLVLMSSWLSGVLLRGAPLEHNVLPALIGFVILWTGVRQSLELLPGTYPARITQIALGLAFPASILFAFSSNWTRSLPYALATAALLILPALLPLRVPALPTRISLRAIATGLLVSTGIYFLLLESRQWQQDQRQAEVQAVLTSLPLPRTEAAFPRHYFHRGVNFTANGFSYETQQARALLKRLPVYGIDSVAIVPYGGMDRQTLRIATARRSSWESDAGVEIMIRSAHSLGMKVLLKPQLWPQPGKLKIAPSALDSWFEQYGAFIEHYARLAQRLHADTLCIGVELENFTGHEAAWRGIIARVRQLYSGPLVYAANHGQEFESIRFWDALDYIGLDNYYPLSGDYDASAVVTKVEAVAARFQRPVLLTEAGFASAVDSHRTPWADHPPQPLSLEEQARCYEAVFQAFYNKPWFAGVYWWKIETDSDHELPNNGMVPWAKPAMMVLQKWFSSPRPDETVNGLD